MSKYIKSKKILILFKYLGIIIGSFLFSFSISVFLTPNNLAPGGISGLSIILNHITGWSVGLLSFIFNLPLLLLGAYKLGTKFLASTIFSITICSIFIDLTSHIKVITYDPLLALIFGGCLCAIGLGIIFRSGATSGGTDIIVRLLRLKYPHISSGILFTATDIIIVTLSAFVFNDIEIAMYAGICVVLMGIIMDKVLYGLDGAKLVFIISDKNTDITDKLLLELEIGVTYIDGKGAYTNTSKKIIMCGTKKQHLPKIQSYVKDIDPLAFMIVSSATEILGEGFKSHNKIQI